MKKNIYTIPLTLVFNLFFLWTISSNLLPTMVQQSMKACKLNTFEASFTETTYWLACFIFPIPIAMSMKRYSCKVGITFGLLLAAVGGLLFFLTAMLREYRAYLRIFFIIATGICFLETAANPYVTVLGAPETAPRRLSLVQSFNGLGAFITAMLLSRLILSDTHYTRETLPVDYPGGRQAYIQLETDVMKLPYLILALLPLTIATVFVPSKLPKAGDGGVEPTSGRKEKLIDFDVLKRSHLRWEVIAQFFYNGRQTAIDSLFLVYCCTYAGLPGDTATTFFRLYMLVFLLGRWIDTGLTVRFRPQSMLLVYTLMNILLCSVMMLWGGMIGLCAMLAISFFMSIMYPTQFSLTLKGLGSQTKSGSTFLVMAVVGNACLPQLTAYFTRVNEHIHYIAYGIPMTCFAFCAYYGWKGYKIID